MISTLFSTTITIHIDATSANPATTIMTTFTTNISFVTTTTSSTTTTTTTTTTTAQGHNSYT